MSWDKNLINLSHFDMIIEILNDVGYLYITSVHGKFMDRGINTFDEEIWHPLRRLQYGSYVVLEQAKLDAGCDIDDVIISHKFRLSEEPKDWQFIVTTDKTGDHKE